MKILVACEESQAVTIELRRLGHEAYSCDIESPSGGYKEWHICCDVLQILNGNTKFRTMDSEIHNVGKWDMIIAFPPCTHLAVSGARHFELKRKDGRQQQGIDFFMQFTELDCSKMAIENPVGIMSTIWRKPDQIIQPFMYGDAVKKSTCLWLKGLPLLIPTNNVENEVKYYMTKNGTRKQSEWSARQLIIDEKKYGYNTKEFKQHRSKTFPGIARAMAEQWAGAV